MIEKNILVTGGAGFIGTHLVKHLVHKYPHYRIINLDALTYSGNLENLTDIEDHSNYTFVKADIRDSSLLQEIFNTYQPDGVFHLAAESHVDRSIENPLEFIETNIIGTVQLMNAARNLWGYQMEGKRFLHISTDEVFGSLGNTGFFAESTPYDPRSPYSASKASSDHMVRAYFHTYDFPVVISNCSNNYGPYQFPEKLIPLVIHNIKNQKPLPVYGDGQYTRDWLWVGDHVEALDLIFHKGELGESYNIGGHNEWKNIDLVEKLCDIMDELLGNQIGYSRSLITFVKDRPGHDRRYAIDPSKIIAELGWKPKISAEEGFKKTAQWYVENEQWLKNVTTGEYHQYYQNMYANR
ncbi:MAG: dTDP-glucose 4,6-dehydratase [Bacteroidota bacterium]|jgi:dTDP-glucose 4,6-dehydratase